VLALAELGDRVVIGMLIRRQVAERHVLEGGALDAPGNW
jgi:hypothetical protein